MYLEERRQIIASTVQEQGRVDVSTLALDLNVTTETVRRDLVALERQGYVVRTHGGAIRVQRLGFEPASAVRESVMADEKLKIARAAVDELPDDGAVILDGGTTTSLMTRFLPPSSTLRVVTNSLQIQQLLTGRPNTTLMSLGGLVRPSSQCSVGPWAAQALRDVIVDVAVIGVNGFSIEHGLTTADQGEAEIKRLMIASARRVVVVADHSKLGADYFHRVADLHEVDTIVTDSGLEASLAEDIRASGPRVVTA